MEQMSLEDILLRMEHNNMCVTYTQWEYIKNHPQIWLKSEVKEDEKNLIVDFDYHFIEPPREPSLHEPYGFGGIFDINLTKVYIPKFLFKNNVALLAYNPNVNFKIKPYDRYNYAKERITYFNVDAEPREEQKEAFDLVDKIWKEKNQINGKFKAAPGWGKTFFSIKTISNLKLRSIVIVPTGVLQEQWINSIIKFSNLNREDIGLIEGSDLTRIIKSKALEKDVCVVMVQTLLSIKKVHGYEKGLELFKNHGLIFYDESHKSGAAEGFSKTVPLFQTDNIIGLSATPYRKGINNFLFENNIGPLIYESDHQNLIPTCNLRRFMIQFDYKQINTLRFMMSDYIRFLAKYNMYLAENEAYIDYVARWVVYRQQQGHQTVVLFSTNKLVMKLVARLKLYGIESGTLTGQTDKNIKVIKACLDESIIAQINYFYFLAYPKKKKLPVLEVGKKYTATIIKIINDINKFIEDDINSDLPMFDASKLIIIPEDKEEESEMEIAKKFNVIVSNFQYLSDGFDKDSLSNIIYGSPIKGVNTVIQSLGRITRINPDKIQDIQADFILTDVIVQFYPRIHWDICSSIKKEYKEAKIHFENFEQVFEEQKAKDEAKAILKREK